MRAGLSERFDTPPTLNLVDPTGRHFEAAQQAFGRRCIEITAVCEVPLNSRSNAIVIPWMICAPRPSRHLELPRFTAPDVIVIHSLTDTALRALRRHLFWFRLADLLCADATPRQATAQLETFCKLHGLSRVPRMPLFECRARWSEAGMSVASLLLIAIEALPDSELREAIHG